MNASDTEPTQDTGESTGEGISDDQLPDDLVAGDDNPLAEGLPPGETVGDLLAEGKPAEESVESDDE